MMPLAAAARPRLRAPLLWVAVAATLVAAVAKGHAAEPIAAEAAPADPVAVDTAPVELVWNAARRVDSPQLVADAQGDLHLFFIDHSQSHPGADVAQLIYRARHGDTWLPPVVLEGRNGWAAAQIVAAVDPSGWLYVLVVGRGENSIYLRTAHVSQALDPVQWSRPSWLESGISFGADMEVEDGGVVRVVNAEREGDVYYRVSNDRGRTWSERVAVSSLRPGQASSSPRLAVDSRGAVYATWTVHEKRNNWGPASVYFAASLDGGQQWMPPRRVAGEGNADLTVGVRGGDEVHLVWKEADECNGPRDAILSAGAHTWTRVETPRADECVLSRGSDVLLHGERGLHLVSSTADRGVNRLWLTSYGASGWSPSSLIGEAGGAGRAGAAPAATLCLGDELHAVFAVPGRGLAHARVEVDEPRVPSRRLPAPRPPTWAERVRGLSLPAWGLLAYLALLVFACAGGQRPRAAPLDRSTAVAVLLAALATAAMGRLPGGWKVEALAWAVLLGAVFWRPPVVLVALIVADVVGGLSIPSGTYTEIPLLVPLMALATAVWAAETVIDRRGTGLRDPIVVLTLALCAVATVSFCLANTSLYPAIERAPLRAQLGGLATFWISGLSLLVALRWAGSRRMLEIVLWLFLCLAAVRVAAHLVPELDRASSMLPTRWGSVICTWTVALAFAQGVFNDALSLPRRAALLVLVAILLINGMGPERSWLAGWVPPLAAVAVIAVRARPATAIAIGAVCAGLALWKLDAVIRLVSVGDNVYSLSTRLDAARIVLQIVALRPFLGIGPANYYPVTGAYEIRGYSVNFSSHNNYIDLLAQTGAVGLLLFLALFALAARRAWVLSGRAVPGFARAFALGALGGIVGTLVAALLGDWVIPFVYNQTLAQLSSSTIAWLFVGCLLAPGVSRRAAVPFQDMPR